MPNFVGGVGSHQPELMIVGEAPGARENVEQTPFVGPSGSILNDCLFKAGLSRSECYITNVVKYQPPFNDMKKLHLIGVDYDKSVQELWDNEIRVLKPKCILAIGNYALDAVCGLASRDNKGNLSGILNYRGSILKAKDGVTKTIPTIHPAALFSRTEGDGKAADTTGGLEWTYLKLIEADIIRAGIECKTRSIDLPSRDLIVCHNSLDLHRFVSQYEKLDKAAADIESINCVPVCIGFAFNRHHAISIPLLRAIGKHKLTDMGDHEMEECWRVIDKLLRRLKLIGHNFKYDEFKLGLIGFETPTIYSDTLLKIRTIFPELPDKRLCVLSSLLTREPFYKDDGKEFKLGKSKIDQLLIYNGRDCAVDKEVDEELEIDLRAMAETYNVPLVEYFYNYMMKKHKFYLEMENRGFDVDLARQKELDKKYKGLQEVEHEALIKLVGHDVNVKSYPQIYELLYKEMRFKPMKRNPTSEDTIVRLMANHAKKPGYKEILIRLLEERRIRTQRSNQINFCPDYDNTCKTSYNISATETCRSSTGILKKPLRPKKMGLSFHTISAHGRLAKDIKSMFRPRKGKCFIKADASQAEARVVAVLAKQWELLAVFDKIDIHRRTAALVLGYTNDLNLTVGHIPIVDDMEKDGPERFCGKKTRHAGNYKMGKGEFMMNFNTDAQKFEIPINISEWKAGVMIEKFRGADTRLETNFWNDIIEAISSTRVLIDPMGGVRVFNGRMDDSIYKEGYANLPQRTVSHLVQGAGLAIYDEIGHDNQVAYFIGEKHDELIMEVPENDWEPYAKLLKIHMQTPIDFSKYCTLKRDYILTIPCDVERSDTHYGDFKKVKLEQTIQT